MKLAIHSSRASYYCGGAERYILNLALNLNLLGEKISLVTYNAPQKSEWFLKFKEEFKGKIVLVDSDEIDRKFKLFKNATNPKIWDKEAIIFSKCANKIYKEKYFQGIICHYAVDCLNIPRKNKIFLHLHGLPDFKRNIENKALKIPTKIIAVSNYVGSGWKRLHGIKKNVYTVYNGIELNQNYPKRNKKSIDVLFFGRLIKIKGVDILLKAISKIVLSHPDIKVCLIGEGPERKKLTKLANKLKLKKNIHFLGHVNDLVLKEAISSSKICVFPSYAREGVMTTLLEASLMKSCILAANSCSNKEYIIDCEDGLFFHNKNEEDLAKKIIFLLNNPQLREKLIKNSYEKVKNWSWKKQTKKLIKIYHSI